MATGLQTLCNSLGQTSCTLYFTSISVICYIFAICFVLWLFIGFSTLSLCVCVCVRACMCVFTCIHREDFICLDQVEYPRTDQRCYVEDVEFLCRFPSSLLQNAEPNLLTSPFILLHTGSGQSHNLTSIRLAFRTCGLYSPLTGVAFGMYYIVSRSDFTSALTRGFAIYLGKAKVTINFSIESSPRKVLSQVQIPSSPHLKMSYFTSKNETPAHSTLERERHDIMLCGKMI